MGHLIIVCSFIFLFGHCSGSGFKGNGSKPDVPVATKSVDAGVEPSPSPAPGASSEAPSSDVSVAAETSLVFTVIKSAEKNAYVVFLQDTSSSMQSRNLDTVNLVPFLTQNGIQSDFAVCKSDSSNEQPSQINLTDVLGNLSGRRSGGIDCARLADAAPNFKPNTFIELVVFSDLTDGGVARIGILHGWDLTTALGVAAMRSQIMNTKNVGGVQVHGITTSENVARWGALEIVSGGKAAIFGTDYGTVFRSIANAIIASSLQRTYEMPPSQSVQKMVSVRLNDGSSMAFDKDYAVEGKTLRIHSNVALKEGDKIQVQMTP